MTANISLKSVEISRAFALSSKARQSALTAVAQAIKTDTNQYVPFATGALRNSARVQSSDTVATLTYGGNGVRYASLQYYATHYKHTTPGTSAKWFEVAKAKRLASWGRVASQAVKAVID